MYYISLLLLYKRYVTIDNVLNRLFLIIRNIIVGKTVHHIELIKVKERLTLCYLYGDAFLTIVLLGKSIN